MKYISHSRPTLGKEEIDRVTRTISSGYIAQGKVVEEFECSVARFIGLKGGVAVSSGSAALHLALIALDVKEGDDVIIPDYTCVAILNAVRYIGANPRFVDIIPGEYNIDPEDLRHKITSKTKAIVLVHAFGLPANVEEIKSFGVPVIEDIAQAIGACRGGRKVGSFGDISVTSFYATKVMTTGEGGMVLSNSTDLLKKVRDLREYDEKDDYVLRFNYKMTDIQAAIGLAQLKKLNEFIIKRREVAKSYNDLFKSLPITLPVYTKDHIYFRYIIECGREINKILSSLRDMGVEAKRPVYRPLHTYLGEDQIINSLNTWNRTISLPVYPSLTEEEKEMVFNAMWEVFKE